MVQSGFYLPDAALQKKMSGSCAFSSCMQKNCVRSLLRTGCSKWRRAFDVQLLPRNGVWKLQHGGVQTQAIGHLCNRCWGIQCIPQHGVADVAHVHPQLMGAASDGLQPQPGTASRHTILTGMAQITGLAGLADAVIDDLQRTALPVTASASPPCTNPG